MVVFRHCQGPRISFKRRRRDSCDIGGKQGMVTSRTVRAAQKVSEMEVIQ